MAELDGYVDRVRRSQPSTATPEAAAPKAAGANPLLTLHRTAGNQAVQRHLRSGVLSRQVVAGLRQTLGNSAVQRLAQAQALPRSTGKGPAEEGVVVAGKEGATERQHAVYRRAIADFQQRNPHDGIATQQRHLLGEPIAAPAASPDQSPVLRRKGKDKGAPAGAPSVGKKTVKGPTAQKFGGFSWTVQWELDKPSPAGGWIVQKVESATDIKKSDGSNVAAPYKGLHPLWEAWPVNKGQSVTTYAETGDLDDDTYGHPAVDAGTKGTVDVTGSAVFYEGLKLPKSFKVTNAAPTWILPATKSDPGLTGGTTALAHNISAKWDGVGADGTTTATTV